MNGGVAGDDTQPNGSNEATNMHVNRHFDSGVIRKLQSWCFVKWRGVMFLTRLADQNWLQNRVGFESLEATNSGNS